VATELRVWFAGEQGTRSRGTSSQSRGQYGDYSRAATEEFGEEDGVETELTMRVAGGHQRGAADKDEWEEDDAAFELLRGATNGSSGRGGAGVFITATSPILGRTLAPELVPDVEPEDEKIGESDSLLEEISA